jgi:hypothetical protein
LNAQTLPIKKIVSKNQSGRLIPDKLFSDSKSFSQPSWRILDCVINFDSEILSVSKRSLKLTQVFGVHDDENLADIG